MVIDWNSNQAYSCPQCNHDTVGTVSSWLVYTCCNCGTRFARFPRLQRVLRHVGITCEFCTQEHPVPVDGKPFGFLRRRHTGVGQDEHPVEAWLYDTDEIPDHRNRVRYRNTRSNRAEAMADLAWWRSMFGPVEDDLSPVLAVVADDQFDKIYGPGLTDEQTSQLINGTLEVYGVGILRPYLAPHRQRGQFYADTDTFTWGLIAPSGLEGIYTKAAPETLAAHAPQL
ncbi:hypothetical protein OG883_44295 [Streptomyces sp. NBC_01142]|uniref:hypothetical protein n=1 Tax=Streptomyces sp. NBC_01142 TaxID=2975865 RepID=UPI0022549711|nr:hypothetical protein [Streptomyces sp. NBC_01142]MCX4826665.1 hypothetical protein [Streptomyces sp. NBC_01142]